MSRVDEWSAVACHEYVRADRADAPATCVLYPLPREEADMRRADDAVPRVFPAAGLPGPRGPAHALHRSGAVEGSFDADDISAWYRTPVELGWDRYTKFDHEFIGREALEAEVADPQRVLATLEWNDEDVIDVYASLFGEGDTFKYMEMPHQQKRAMIADRVLKDGEDVSVATMRGYSYYFREMLSLCTIDVEHSDVGTEVTVLWGEGKNPTSPTVEDHVQKEIRATVARTPYKEDRRRANLA